ncbi:MAG: single-stranded DNA-binding protein [Thermoplasmata archaeon M8B2D]|nr:MAG: single-stranded DNA-binding protein [Thermoplasmata archaeon M8B2D]
MNKCIFIPRLTRDIELKYSQNDNPIAIAKFSGAVQRRFKRDNEPDVDFLNFIAFGKQAETIEKYFHKGDKIGLTCHVQTGNYTNKDGIKIYTTDFIIDEFEFVESKKDSNNKSIENKCANDEFVNIPDGIDEELPFN